jgi:hypothetical protein
MVIALSVARFSLSSGSPREARWRALAAKTLPAPQAIVPSHHAMTEL